MKDIKITVRDLQNKKEKIIMESKISQGKTKKRRKRENKKTLIKKIIISTVTQSDWFI